MIALAFIFSSKCFLFHPTDRLFTSQHNPPNCLFSFYLLRVTYLLRVYLPATRARRYFSRQFSFLFIRGKTPKINKVFPLRVGSLLLFNQLSLPSHQFLFQFPIGVYFYGQILTPSVTHRHRYMILDIVINNRNFSPSSL